MLARRHSVGAVGARRRVYLEHNGAGGEEDGQEWQKDGKSDVDEREHLHHVVPIAENDAQRRQVIVLEADRVKGDTIDDHGTRKHHEQKALARYVVAQRRSATRDKQVALDAEYHQVPMYIG